MDMMGQKHVQVTHAEGFRPGSNRFSPEKIQQKLQRVKYELSSILQWGNRLKITQLVSMIVLQYPCLIAMQGNMQYQCLANLACNTLFFLVPILILQRFFSRSQPMASKILKNFISPESLGHILQLRCHTSFDLLPENSFVSLPAAMSPHQGVCRKHLGRFEYLVQGARGTCI